MTDIDLNLETTEDGIRLIELMGERADVLFDMDHLLYSSWLLFLVAALIVGLIAFGLFCCTELFYDRRWNRDRLEYDYFPRPRCRRNQAIAVVGLVALFLLLCFALYTGWGIHLDKDLASIDAQIEAIRIRHPEWGFRGDHHRDAGIECDAGRSEEVLQVQGVHRDGPPCPGTRLRRRILLDRDLLSRHDGVLLGSEA